MNLKDSKNHIPWVTFEAKNWLDNFLKKEMCVFECGSGGSTLYFCKKVKKVVSIEHNRDWYNKVSGALNSEKITSRDYFLVEPKYFPLAKFLPYNSRLYNSKTFPEYENSSFRSYVKKIDEYPDGFFNLVFVDGRSRISCVRHSLRKIKKGGILMLDNSERAYYQSATDSLKKYERIDFRGKGPFSDDEWQTSVWQIDRV